MILKMWNEVTSTWFYVDDVNTISSNIDYCFHIDGADEGNLFGVLVVFRPKNGGEGSIVIPNYDVNTIENLDDYTMDKNLHSICVADHVLAKREDAYKTRDVFRAKYVSVNAKTQSEKSILLPFAADIYLLNSEGKTIDRI